MSLGACTSSPDDLTGSDQPASVSVTVTLPEGEQVTQTFTGPAGSELAFAGDLVQLSQRMVESSNSGATASVSFGDRTIQIVSSRSVTNEPSLCPVLVILPDAAPRLAEARGYGGVRTSPGAEAIVAAKRSCSIDDRGYHAGQCGTGAGMGTSTGCIANWSCTDGSSGCAEVNGSMC